MQTERSRARVVGTGDVIGAPRMDGDTEKDYTIVNTYNKKRR